TGEENIGKNEVGKQAIDHIPAHGSQGKQPQIAFFQGIHCMNLSVSQGFRWLDYSIPDGMLQGKEPSGVFSVFPLANLT
ncbi:MAG: hypothetical protein J6A48_00015, partial [Clostridia bacterium]|nr:hypothetical protein [Clostridia bacterium]